MANDTKIEFFSDRNINGPYKMFIMDYHWILILALIMMFCVILAVFIDFLVIRHLITKSQPKRPIDYLLLIEQVSHLSGPVPKMGTSMQANLCEAR